ncbi:MAG TPA: hypothetical protein VG649_16125, partial [Candidatus Angelobacter sp.]|nr:hypothetical protein [Candidatus Angelobacter sp.]
MSASLIFLGVCTFALQVSLLVLMAKRKLRKQFPIFYNYLFLLLFFTVALQVSARWFLREYPFVYWTSTGLTMLLGFGVLYEVFVNVLKPFSELIDLGKMMFRWAALFLLITAFITAVATTGSRTTKLCTAILLMEHCVQLIQCGFLLLLLAFETRLGLSWRSHGMCIALGLGVFASTDLLLTYLYQKFPAWQAGLDMTNGIIAFSLFAFWTVGLLLPEPARKSAQDSPARIILQRWNEAWAATSTSNGLTDIAFAPADSFIPGVEKAVERVLAR